MATYWENSCSFGLLYVSWYKYLIVYLVLSHLGFWSGNLFLIAPFPDLCLLVPFYCLASDQSIAWSCDMPYDCNVTMLQDEIVPGNRKFYCLASCQFTGHMISHTTIDVIW